MIPDSATDTAITQIGATAVIHFTCGDPVDNKTVSEWARALRYVAHCKVSPTQLKTFMKEVGGVNACADRYAKYLGRIRREVGTPARMSARSAIHHLRRRGWPEVAIH
jgi:hypothetical protein